MALNLPKISAPTVGEANRLNPMRAPKAPKLAPYKAPKAPAKTTGAGVAANDQFLLGLPYNPKTINQTAQTGYDQDTANAQKLAGMGYLTQAQRDAQAGNQASQSTNIAAALAAQIAGIQGATVAQGNASGAALGAQNAATAQSGAGVASATGAPAPAGVSPGAVNALLGTQNAATGNLYGGLEAAAYAGGAQNAKQAYANEAVNVQNDNLSQQKMLASLLAGEPTVTARESTMQTANQQAQAANLQTELSQYQNGVQQQEYYSSLGEKKQATAQGLANARLLAGISQEGQNERAALSSSTSTANAALGAKTSTTNAALGAKTSKANAALAAKTSKGNAWLASQTSLKVADIKKLQALGAKAPKNFKVTVLVPATTAVDPNTGKLKTVPAKRVFKTIPANVWYTFNSSGQAPVGSTKGSRKLAILGVPEGSKVQAATGY